ncbi:MAG: DUF1476 domain-containing protein [Asticcacaulis sp.]
MSPSDSRPTSSHSADAMEGQAARRRNHLIGLWAAEKMGLGGAQGESYARAVERAHGETPSEEDVIRKVLGDLVASNVTVRESEVRTKAAEFLAQAREALKNAG